MGFQLAPEKVHVHVDHIGAGVEGKAPDVAEDLIACAECVGAVDQEFQERELAWGERYLVFPRVETVSRQVEA